MTIDQIIFHARLFVEQGSIHAYNAVTACIFIAVAAISLAAYFASSGAAKG